MGDGFGPSGRASHFRSGAAESKTCKHEGKIFKVVETQCSQGLAGVLHPAFGVYARTDRS